MGDSTLWKLPVPATALLGEGPKLEKRLGREVAILFQYEDDERDVNAAIVFEGVEAFSLTYVTSCDRSMLVAYAKLVDRGETEWLAAVRVAMRGNGVHDRTVRHLMIYFDDGPCYEIICQSFRVEQHQATGIELPPFSGPSSG
jgi:hypothetical protein